MTMIVITRRFRDLVRKQWMIHPSFTVVSPPFCYNHYHTVTNHHDNSRMVPKKSIRDSHMMVSIFTTNHSHPRLFSTTTTSNDKDDNPFWNAMNVYFIQEEEEEENKSSISNVLKQFPEYTSKQIMDWERMYQILSMQYDQYKNECDLLSYVLATYYGPIQGQWNIAMNKYLSSSTTKTTISHERLLLESQWNLGMYSNILNETGPSLLLRQQQQQETTTTKKHAILHQAYIYNAMALSSIMTTVGQDNDDTDSSIVFFQKANDNLLQSKSLLLENTTTNDDDNQAFSSSLAIIESNLIILQILSSTSSSSSNHNDDTSIDNKDIILSQWEQILTKLQHTKDNNNSEMIQIQIWASIVQYLLTHQPQDKVSKDDLQLASKYAKQALDMASSSKNQMYLGRALWCVSQCFAKTGTTAITAEGLYQSCLDATSSTTSSWQQVLLHACVQQSYGTFLQTAYDDNKRSSEAKIYQDKSHSILLTLPRFQNNNNNHTSSATNVWKQNAWYSYLSLCIDGIDTIRNNIFNQ